MDRINQLLRVIRTVIGNDRAIANAGRLLDQRRFEDRVVATLAARVTEATPLAA